MIKVSKIPISVNVTVGTIGSPVYNGLAELKIREDKDGMGGLIGADFDSEGIRESITREIEFQLSTNTSFLSIPGKIIISEQEEHGE